MPLSCIPSIVMQKVSQGANWTENADKAEEAESVQHAYYLRHTNVMSEMQEVLAERGGLIPPAFSFSGQGTQSPQAMTHNINPKRTR
jgi:hypothetical protein